MSAPDDMPPLDDELLASLKELADEDPPPDAMARVRMRLDATIAAAPPPAPTTEHPASATDPTSALAGATRIAATKLAAITFFVGVGVGLGVGYGVFGRATKPQVEVRVVREVVEVPAPPREVSPGDLPGAVAPGEGIDAGLAGGPTTAPARAPAATSSEVDSRLERDRALADENALVTRAQSALARGRAGEALEALTEHRRRFPSGQFAEEREAMAIQALVRLGRIDAARERADRFRERYPRSMLVRAVDAAVGASP